MAKIPETVLVMIISPGEKFLPAFNGGSKSGKRARSEINLPRRSILVLITFGIGLRPPRRSSFSPLRSDSTKGHLFARRQRSKNGLSDVGRAKEGERG